MPTKKYIVRLSEEERNQLNRLVKTGKTAAYKRQRAQILLKADDNRATGSLQDKAIAESLRLASGQWNEYGAGSLKKGSVRYWKGNPRVARVRRVWTVSKRPG